MMNEWNICVRMETTTEPSGTFFQFFESEEEEGKFLESHMSTNFKSWESFEEESSMEEGKLKVIKRKKYAIRFPCDLYISL